MTYSEIIQDNGNRYSPVPWWPNFAFHYTDVMNAVSILRDGKLYSRQDATRMELMTNDNASRQVIDMTRSGATSSVRFYYRPLTPTQYHNEGYKHPGLRYCHDTNANVPVPVFFLFNLEKLLSLPETMFSEESLAGGGGILLKGVENFAALDFAQIYKRGPMEDVSLEKKRRHAEIIYPGELSIDEMLESIICRNEIERLTLLNLLRKTSGRLFSRYKSYITVDNSCFENNGLYIDDCRYYNEQVVVVFSSTYNKKRYTERYKDECTDQLAVQAYADFEWMDRQNVIEHKECSFIVDYENPRTIAFTNLTKPAGASALYMHIYFESRLVCYVCWHTVDSAML